jgi:hypothetical protein
MKRILLLSFFTIAAAMANGQKLLADKLMDILSFTAAKTESFLLSKKYRVTGEASLGDTLIKTFQYNAVPFGGKKKQADTAGRRVTRSVLKETFILTYQTTSAAEYRSIITDLKKKGFYCEYEKDSTVRPASYLYQHEDITADASVRWEDGKAWYSVSFFKKILPADKGLYFAEDLLQFSSHEYLVYYFGAKNVKKDIYYFGKDDLAKCSVLLINTKRQVIFIWKDGLNRRKIGSLLLGSHHKLKSQEGVDSVNTENSWLLRGGIYAGMPLFDLRELNGNNIAFCGGEAPNPGLVLPESSAKVDFGNKDVILGCTDCNDDKFINSKIMYADKAMKEGRHLFIFTIALYPSMNVIFD